ncbi:unnamed protein product [Schistocephalus solidus]|uniref:WD_REPEATS_REGION domain-containing protein n=1 Tax=Schistocephalus solidus TaxID=70667 RepID=A0A183STS7_SCHSO|nr:unnamed protein product [Schistocephalus solidus]
MGRRLSTGNRRSVTGMVGASPKKSGSDSNGSIGPLRLYDDEGNDITPLPMIIEDRRRKEQEKENTLDPSVLQVSSIPHHGTAFSRSAVSISNPFMDSTTDTSEDTTKKKESTFAGCQLTPPSAPDLGISSPCRAKLFGSTKSHQLLLFVAFKSKTNESEEMLDKAALDKHVNILVTETETFWLFDQPPCVMSTDNELDAWKHKVDDYDGGGEREGEGGGGGYADEDEDDDGGGDGGGGGGGGGGDDDDDEVYGGERKKEEELKEAQQSAKGSAASNKQFGEESKKISIDGVPNAIRRSLLNSSMPMQLASPEQEVVTPDSLASPRSQPISESTETGLSDPKDPILSSAVKRSTYGPGTNFEAPLPPNDPQLIKLLHGVERALNLNSYHDKLVQYKSCLLSSMVVPVEPDHPDTELSSQMTSGLGKTKYSAITEDNTTKGGHSSGHKASHTGSTSGIVIEKHHQPAPTDQSSNLPGQGSAQSAGPNAGDDAQGTATTAAASAAAATNLQVPKTDLDAAKYITPDLALLWKFACNLTKGRNVSDMAFNVQNKDILAVGYGQFVYDQQRSGLVCCWSLKNVSYPERIYRTPSGVTAVAWSARNQNLLAVRTPLFSID